MDVPRSDNPYIGNRPIAEIMPLQLLNVFRRLEAGGKHEKAHRTKQRCGQVFRYAVATGRALRDPTQDLRGARAPLVTTHHAAITESRRIGELLRALHGYIGLPMTEAALKLAPLFFVRPGELRKAEFSPQSRDRPMSENAITAALRRMGYSGQEMTWYGFRTIASTCLNELGGTLT